MDFLLNDKKVCTSEAIYNTKLNVNGKEWTTISEMTDCTTKFRVKKGDQVKLRVHFDELAHPKRESGGEEQEEMGFAYATFLED
jgi:hypothetical protein